VKIRKVGNCPILLAFRPIEFITKKDIEDITRRREDINLFIWSGKSTTKK